MTFTLDIRSQLSRLYNMSTIPFNFICSAVCMMIEELLCISHICGQVTRRATKYNKWRFPSLTAGCCRIRRQLWRLCLPSPPPSSACWTAATTTSPTSTTSKRLCPACSRKEINTFQTYSLALFSKAEKANALKLQMYFRAQIRGVLIFQLARIRPHGSHQCVCLRSGWF